jgi:hypothetical protein
MECCVATPQKTNTQRLQSRAQARAYAWYTGGGIDGTASGGGATYATCSCSKNFSSLPMTGFSDGTWDTHSHRDWVHFFGAQVSLCAGQAKDQVHPSHQDPSIQMLMLHLCASVAARITEMRILFMAHIGSSYPIAHVR